MTIGILALAAALASGQAPATGTLQQQFEAAAALDRTGTPEQRFEAWRALAAHGASKRSTAVFRIRESAALVALGRLDEAADAARAGLADLPTGDATLTGDRYDAEMTLAAIARMAIDYATAAQAYRAAEPLAQNPSEQLSVAIGLIETETFLDPAAAQTSVARADAIIAANRADTVTRALVRRLDAELRLNRGDLEGARAQAAQAVQLLGGLTEKTDLNDVAARSDYAIAALLLGRTEDAQHYMAMTGAGRLPDHGFDPAVQMHAPDCGGDAGLKPQDMAVVEFSIADDGRVVNNVPIYAAGGGAVALAFARAVADWSWTPEQARELPLFFRNRVRVQMRCSTAFTRPSIAAYLDAQLTRWLEDKGVDLPPPPEGSEAAVLPGERALLAAAEAKNGPNALALVPVLRLLAANEVVGKDETATLAGRALAILAANGATGLPRLAMERRVWATHGASRGLAAADIPDTAFDAYAADPAARAAIRLMRADALARQPDQARPYLQQVANDAALPATDAIKIGALVRLASLEQGAKHVDAARAAYQASGVTGEQCEMIDSGPHLVRVGGTFPEEALKWGFEGWAAVQYDVDAAGKVRNQRAVIAYPPFVFSKAGENTFATALYSKSYRPDGGLGCGGETTRVRFALPAHASGHS